MSSVVTEFISEGFWGQTLKACRVVDGGNNIDALENACMKEKQVEMRHVISECIFPLFRSDQSCFTHASYLFHVDVQR